MGCQGKSNAWAETKGSFYRGSFSQRGASAYCCPWGGFGVGFRKMVGEVFLWKIREKGKGWGGRVGGWGRDQQRNRQVNAQTLAKLP